MGRDECPPGLCDKTDSDNCMLQNYTEGCRHWKGYHKDPYRGNYKRVVILLGPDNGTAPMGLLSGSGAVFSRRSSLEQI